jgi:DNA polymerase III delta prime subunit
MGSLADEENTVPSSRRVQLCRRLWLVLRYFWVSIVLVIFMGCIPAVLFLTTDTQLNHLYIVQWWNSWIAPHFSFAVAATVAVVGLTVLSWIGSHESLRSFSHPTETAHFIVLGMLRRAYTTELTLSLQGVLKRIDLALHERLDLTLSPEESPWQPGTGERVLPGATTIVEVYDQGGRGLLILGEPGTGKTTLLYDLAQTFLSRAEQNEKQPLPILLNLSPWGLKRLPFEEWIAEELELRFNLSRRFWRQWLQEDKLLLLLDGLDEVAPPLRGSCIEALNRYHAEHITPLIVSSRREEYLAQSQRLALQSAVVIQPLTPDQVKAYLKEAGRKLAAVQKVVQTNAVFYELLTTPLMLSVVIQAYQGKNVKELPQTGSVEEQRRMIFDYYRKRMLDSHRKRRLYSSECMQHWLVWLAKQMQRRSQSVFYLERLQADWLEAGPSQRVYEWAGVRLPNFILGLLASLFVSLLLSANLTWQMLYVLGLGGGLVGEWLYKQQFRSKAMQTPHQVLHPLFAALITSVLIGLFTVLGAIWLDIIHYVSLSITNLLFIGGWAAGLSLLLKLLTFRLPQYSYTRASSLKSANVFSRFWRDLWTTEIAKYALVAGGLSGISIWLLGWLSGGGAQDMVSKGLDFGLFLGLSTLLIGFLLRQVPNAIEPAEVLVWSRKSLWRSLMNKRHVKDTLTIGLGTLFMVGLALGLVGFLDGWLDTGLGGGVRVALRFGLSVGLSVGLTMVGSYWLLMGLFQGISYSSLQQQHRIALNEGIRRSASNGVLLGLLSGVICVVVSGFAIFVADVSGLWLNDQIIYWFGDGLIYFIGSGLSCGPSCWSAFALNDWLSRGPMIGLIGGLLVVIVYGGLAWWRHWLLRFLLWRSRAIPWHYEPMLDEASQCILLRKEGGGYRFIHDLFRDSLASLDATTPPPSVSPL